MDLPFTPAQFVDVFRQYNQAIFPIQGALIAAAVAILALVGLHAGGWKVYALLACLWTWMGAVYHIGFFRQINPAAVLFGIAFLAQGVIFAVAAVRRPQVQIRRDLKGVVGGLLAAYALIGYPALAWSLGQRYAAMPTFGSPCPTTIFTFAVLLWTRSPQAPWIWAVPVLWAAVGTSAAIQLAVPEDFGLPVAALSSVWLLLRRRSTNNSS